VQSVRRLPHLLLEVAKRQTPPPAAPPLSTPQPHLLYLTLALASPPPPTLPLPIKKSVAHTRAISSEDLHVTRVWKTTRRDTGGGGGGDRAGMPSLRQNDTVLPWHNSSGSLPTAITEWWPLEPRPPALIADYSSEWAACRAQPPTPDAGARTGMGLGLGSSSKCSPAPSHSASGGRRVLGGLVHAVLTPVRSFSWGRRRRWHRRRSS